MLEVFREATRIGHLDRPYGDWPRAVTTTPADLMGLAGAGRIGPGQPADLVLFRAALQRVAVAAAGGPGGAPKRPGDRAAAPGLSRPRRPGRKGRRVKDRELLNPPGVHPPQAHYSHVARAGQTLYISGQLAMDPSGAVVGVGDARAQARRCYDNLAVVVAHYGGSLRHLVDKERPPISLTGPIDPWSPPRATRCSPRPRIPRTRWWSCRAWPSRTSWSRSKGSPSSTDSSFRAGRAGPRG